MKRLIIAAVFVLTACGTAENSTPQVASLQTSGTTATGAAQPEQQRARIDDTPEQARARSKPYGDCMSANGMPDTKEEAAAMPAEEYKRLQPIAFAKCEHLYLLPPWEYDKSNPESLDFIHRVVECLRAAGAKAEERPAGPGEQQNSWAYVGDNSHIGTLEGMELTQRCEKESLRK
ncbi:hypothetical protein FKR81_39815 [Lentzea tibetensis]|uniref:Lipoprotein n=1 Tax=Lentzea tibetensis TaxID=2591470 RepID=A0A563EGR5_9PSEU|nr:hypothetical protein [Lentzea tibetensis]TWP45223.1 hypothetical protein FKR81_39815 [Lentzea tibetensis]